MATEKSSRQVGGDYFLIRPERIGWLNLLSLLVLRRRLGAYKFVESSEEVRIRADIITVLTVAIQKFLLSIEKPLRVAGCIIEFILNFLALNGGLLGLIKNIITG